MDLFTPGVEAQTPEPADQDSLAAYAQRAYLEYALSVVKGRDRKSTRLNSSHIQKSRMPSSA